MGGRVIQGFFIGGAMRPVQRTAAAEARPRAAAGAPPPAFAGRAAPLQARMAPGRPPLAHRGPAAVAQPHGGDGSFAIDPVQIGLARGGGKPLPPALLAKMESALGADFSAVRVHVGPQAARIGAIAFTAGNDLYFAPGQFQPDSVQGQQLIGHELAHVVQQRQGRVRAPGAGMAVVQDRALEAEADRLGMRAAAHRPPVQAKMAGAGGPPVHISARGGTAPGSHRLTVGSGANPIGSLVVHTGRGAAAEVTDLGVAAGHRDRGIGRQLLESAARAGLRSGNSKLSLSAQDNGSGKLTRWYKDMGFRQVGVNGRGMPVLEAPISRLLAGAVQRRVAFPIQRSSEMNMATESDQATFLTATNMTTEKELCANLVSTKDGHSEDLFIDKVLPQAADNNWLIAGQENLIFIGINRSPCTSTDHMHNGSPSCGKAAGKLGCAERLIALVAHGFSHGGKTYPIKLQLQVRHVYGSDSMEGANSAKAIEAMIATGKITCDSQRIAESTTYRGTATAKAVSKK